MKIKKSQLKQIIKEELEAAMDEGIYDKFKKFAGLDFDDYDDEESSYKTPEQRQREKKEKLEQEYNISLGKASGSGDWLIRRPSGEITGPYATLDSVEIYLKRRRDDYLAKQEPIVAPFRSANPSLDSDFVSEKKARNKQ